jgi:hypothetical protein
VRSLCPRHPAYAFSWLGLAVASRFALVVMPLACAAASGLGRAGRRINSWAATSGIGAWHGNAVSA